MPTVWDTVNDTVNTVWEEVYILGDKLLQEDGTALLQEDSEFIYLEGDATMWDDISTI